MNAMDERTAAILQEAYDTIERVERGQAERAAEREQREAITAVSDSPRRRTAPRERVIYKTTRQPEQSAAMDAATTEGWNKWADARIRAAVQKGLEEFADILGAEAGQLEQRLLTELKRLSAEVDALREDVRAANAKNVTPIRSANVA